LFDHFFSINRITVYYRRLQPSVRKPVNLSVLFHIMRSIDFLEIESTAFAETQPLFVPFTPLVTNSIRGIQTSRAGTSPQLAEDSIKFAAP